ncbi:DNA polymerase ligase N-terminal domain-containing protein [Christiangramia flava]|uniref:ATP-dependent DNA ligase clustered with Ku protein, LigD n=1 Tax=Christiangramia flava JLT2011 TaxID=1229726 RepID=A0A1L7I4I2_9FLAO|nr:DNA polymerase ligase N-terminal domain-containing protein [Christiangramia flava]APU68528.1 ATP-dependent DNA ligase clustered with Ku protein, LigD [Christiangramia flava JLT2011]OSS40684.1 ATP-dependent DNA ligase [Christiangramia flava JLT2011]
MAKDFLKKYREKRDFDISAEPFGDEVHKKDEDKQIFVIQMHNATNLHFDFRLLVDGVLKSWAVPKGPSTDPHVKRLAIRTEDHPLNYADFEGVIPEGQYGGGTVMVWDAGTYENDKTNDQGEKISMAEQLREGHSTFILNGKKLRGGYTLIRTRKGEKEQWILKKVDDDQADARRNPVSTEKKSVLTGRTMKEIQKDAEKNG